MILFYQVLSNMLCGLQVIAMAEAMLVGKGGCIKKLDFIEDIIDALTKVSRKKSSSLNARAINA